MSNPVKILVMNAGSSSHKACVYDFPDPNPLWQGLVDWTKEPGMAVVTTKTAQGKRETKMPNTDRSAVLLSFLASIWQGEGAVIDRGASSGAWGQGLSAARFDRPASQGNDRRDDQVCAGA
jgi:hypothetical protein